MSSEASKDDLLERAWVLIANAGSGDWTRETEEWRRAAEKWRDSWLASGRNEERSQVSAPCPIPGPAPAATTEAQ